MADKKNFSLTGIGSNVQIGKSGGRIKFSVDHLEARNAADSGFIDVYVPLTPGDDQAAASKSYVDEFTTTLIDAKNSVRVATTADGPFATAYDAGSSVDAVVLVAGDRLLIKNQSDGTENGIYIVQASGNPVRAPDANTDAEITQGAFCFVVLGTQNALKTFVITTADPITLDSTAITWAETQPAATVVIDAKDSVRVATTINGAIATEYENGDTVDDIVLATGDRILLKDQSDPIENGLYVVNVSGAPTRTSDADTDAKVTQGAFCFVAEGTDNGATSFILTTVDPILVDTTGQVWEEVGGGGGNSFGIVTGDTGTATADTATDTLQLQGATSGGITTTGSDAPELITFGLTPVDLATTGATMASGDFIIVSDSADAATVLGQKITFANAFNDLGVPFAGGNLDINILDIKLSVRIATTANISLTGEQTIDDIATSTDRILVKNQSAGAENGIYVTAAGAWSRASDSDADAEVTQGSVCFVVEGTANEKTSFILVTVDPITVGSTAQVWESAGGGGGSGVTEELDIKLSVTVTTTVNIALTGEQTIDDVLTSTDRILVKDQSTASENGIYVTDAGAWSRAADSDADAKVTQGNVVFISEGTVAAKFSYILTTADPITVGSTDQVWEQTGGAAGASDFVSLTDTPSDYTDDALKVARVNAAENALEFVSPSIGSFGNPFSGALLQLDSDFAIPDASTISVDWDSANYDVGSWFNISNPERLTVPSGITKIRLTAALTLSNWASGLRFIGFFRKNGSDDSGEGLARFDLKTASAGTPGGVLSSSIINVVPGDWFEVRIHQDSAAAETLPGGATISAEHNFFSIEAVESIAPASKVIGPWLELDRQVADNTSDEIIVTFNPALYDELEWVFTGYRPASDAAVLRLRVSEDGGSTFKAGGSDYYSLNLNVNSTAPTSSAVEGADLISLQGTVDNATNRLAKVIIRTDDLSQVGDKNFEYRVDHINTSGNIRTQDGQGSYRGSTNPVNGLRLFTDGGNIAEGTIILRGRPKAGVDFYSSSRSLTGMPFSGALLNLTVDETLTTNTPIPWDEAIYDVGGWFDLSGNPTRLTIPAGITKIRITAGAGYSSSPIDIQFYAIKNGVRVDGGGWVRTGNPNTQAITYTSAILEVVAGDYFEMNPTFGSGSPVLREDVVGGSFFAIEAVEAIAPSVTPRGAVVTIASSILTANYSAGVDIPFDEEVYDTDDIHDNSVNNTRLTVPSGVTHVRLSGNIGLQLASSNSVEVLKIHKNGAAMNPSAEVRMEMTNADPALDIQTSILEVVAGDYFTLNLLITDTSVTISEGRTQFAMEIVRPAIIAGLSPDTLSAKASVVAATDIAGTLATSFEDGDVIDGVTLATGDRILIKDQSAGAENGIYVVRPTGAPSRAADANSILNTEQGNYVFVSEGTANGATSWLITTDNPIIPDIDAQVWTSAGAGGGGGAAAWTDLTDTPGSFAGEAGKFPVVNEAEDAIELTTALDASLIAGETSDLFHVQRQASNGTSGGNTVSGTWNFHSLTDELVNEIVGASISAGQITLPAGTYDTNIMAFVYESNSGRCRLRNITDGTTTILGHNIYSATADTTGQHAIAQGRFTITGTKVFEVQTWTNVGKTTDGLGISSSGSGEVEVYTDIQFRRIGTSVPFTKVIGPWVEIDRQTASASSEIDFTFDPLLYDDLEITFTGVIGASDARELYLRCSTDGGSTFDTGANYSWAGRRQGTVPTGADQGAAGTTFIQVIDALIMGNVAGEQASGIITCHALDDAVNFSSFGITTHSVSADNAAAHHQDGAGAYEVATAVNALRLFLDTGNIASGTFILRGRPRAGIDFFHGEPVGGNVGAPFAGAMVKLDANDTDNYSAGKAVPWESRVYTFGGSWWNSTLPTRLTVPAGVSKVRLSGLVRSTGEATSIQALYIIKNGVSSGVWIGTSATLQELAGSVGQQTVSTGVVEVVEGDYFELGYQGSDSSTTVESDRSSFSIEAVEAIAPSSKVVGPWLELDRQVVNAVTEIDFTFNPLLYDDIEIVIRGMTTSGDTANPAFRVSEDGGTTFKDGATDYSQARWLWVDDDNSNATGGAVSKTEIDIAGNTGNDINEKVEARIFASGLEAAEHKLFQISVVNVNSTTNLQGLSTVGRYKGTTNPVNAIRIFEVGADTISGTFILRGRPKDGVDFFHTKDSIEKVGIPFSGAAVNKSALEIITTSTDTELTWNQEVYDIGDWHDNSINNKRFTVPAGITKIVLKGHVRWEDNATANLRQGRFFKNGSALGTGGSNTRTLPNSTNFVTMSLDSGVIEVIEGDYFELSVFQSTGGDLDVLATDSGTSFSVQAIEGVAPKLTPRGALVTLAADELTADYNPARAIPFDQEAYDTDSIHDNSTNNSRLTVPSGVTHVRLTGNVHSLLANSGEFAILTVRKNGALNFDGAAQQQTEITNTENRMNVSTPVLEVVAGDYFELWLRHELDDSVTIDADETNFAMEIVEPILLGDGGPMDIAVSLYGVPLSNQIMVQYVFVRNAFFPKNLIGSSGYAKTTASASVGFDIQKNGSSIGSVTFLDSVAVPTFAFSASQQFEAGDRLEIIAPAVVSTLADFAITLKGERR